MRNRAFRRFQEDKKKKEAKNHSWVWYREDVSPKTICILAHSPARCSCHMCGNPRKYYKNSHPFKPSEARKLGLNTL